MKGVVCPDCDAPMVLRDSVYGKFYGCSNYPGCTAKHGAHQKTGKPLGIPADKETREWRVKAHAEFDKLWQPADAPMTRGEAYTYMREIMGLSKQKAHIGKFNLYQCRELIRKLEVPT